MPVFVFVSGFFGKSEHSRSFDGVKGFLFLYLIFNSCLWLYNGFTNEFTSILEPIYSYWYLMAIVVWRLVTPHIAKSDKTVAISAVIALCIGFCGDIDNKFALARTIGFYPYYLMGYLLSKESDKALRDRPYAKRAAAGTMFAGDLILLEDQVKLGYKDGHYDYSEVFEPAKKYITESDFAIGVFEGPMAGEAVGYSSSNYDDGKELYLNFPDEFGYAVKNAGFDLVTTANNHLMDRGEAGAEVSARSYTIRGRSFPCSGNGASLTTRSCAAS